MALTFINEELLDDILKFLAEMHPENVEFSAIKRLFPLTDSEQVKDHLEKLEERNLINFGRADSRDGKGGINRGYISIHLSERGKSYMREKMRLLFLLESHGISGGLTTKLVSIPDLANKLKISRDKAREIAHFLFSENKINYFQDEDSFKMQALGVKEAVSLIAKGENVKEIENNVSKNKVFVVHGHDNIAKDLVAGFLSSHELKPIVLHRQADRGRTLIDKFEKHASGVGYAVILFTPDDMGAKKPKRLTENILKELRPRARQNVVFELGFFVGQLGRENVRVLHNKGVEILSDFAGVLYTQFNPKSDAWKIELHREISAAGLPIKKSIEI